jgi:hypothetical protein
MNRNGRIYPEYQFRFEFTKRKIRLLDLYYSEDYTMARYEDKNIRIIKDYAHARVIKRKTKFADIIPGDVLYTKLYWTSLMHESSGMTPVMSERTGMAIERKGKIIWYLMPGKLTGLAERKILIEKITSTKKQTYILEGILQRFDRVNR